MNRTSVLIVEDDRGLREALTDTLKLTGYPVVEAENATSALQILADENVGMVISDVQMEGMDGHTLLKKIRSEHPEIPVVLMTAYGTIQKAVEAMQSGAVDYLVKPFQAEVLANMVERYMPEDISAAGDLIAEDNRTKEVLTLAHRVADSDATVLITGESGSGKEVFAREIHRHSRRAKGPFVAINCAAIPENMLEAMLFGYEKGSFTGAYKSSPGKFEMANGGTLLLDEISEMDIGLQAKLLRVLQEREVERLGGSKPIALDVRVLATTNREMRKEVAEGRFREDLYYRLNVFPLHLPPLRERSKDVVPLMKFLLRRHTEGTGKGVPKLTTEAERKLTAHDWPGNVRELDNVAQRALILQIDNTIDESQILFETAAPSMKTEMATVAASAARLDDANEPSPTDVGLLGENLRSREYKLIVEALRSTNGNRKQAAEKLGVSERTLRYKLARMREDGVAIPPAWGG